MALILPMAAVLGEYKEICHGQCLLQTSQMLLFVPLKHVGEGRIQSPEVQQTFIGFSLHSQASYKSQLISETRLVRQN